MKIKSSLRRFARAMAAHWVEVLFGAIGFAFLYLFAAVIFYDGASMDLQSRLGIAKKEGILRFLGVAAGGFIALYGLVAFNRRAMAQIVQNKLQLEQNALMAEGLFQEKFRAAIGHLGSESINAVMRIASFYEFYYLAKERKDYAQSILAILCVHLRTTAAASAASASAGELAKGGVAKQPEEVKVLTNLLFGKATRDAFLGLRYDLQNANLSGMDFVGMQLSAGKVNLEFANLSNTNLPGQNLQNVQLKNANLQGANLQRANLRGVDLRGADLRGADLRRTDLREADLREADLTGAEYDGKTQFPDGFEPAAAGMVAA